MTPFDSSSNLKMIEPLLCEPIRHLMMQYSTDQTAIQSPKMINSADQS